MKIVDLNLKNNEIKALSKISKSRYENIFNVGTNNEYYFYNIIKTVKFPEDLSPGIFYNKTITNKAPYTAISFDVYSTQDLWWFILLTNNITNPISVVQPGTVLKIIKKEYVDDIINNILKLNNA
jgi:hypothetical protein